MGDHDHRETAACKIAKTAECLPLERIVAYRQDLVDDQDVGIQMCGDGKPESRVHAGRVALHWCVEELLDLGKRDDLVELAPGLAVPHSHHGALQENVLPSCEVLMEPGGDLDERSNASADQI